MVLTDVSEELIAYIFRVEGKEKRIRKKRNSESRSVKTSNLTNPHRMGARIGH
jgi:hypothetical protein